MADRTQHREVVLADRRGDQPLQRPLVGVIQTTEGVGVTAARRMALPMNQGLAGSRLMNSAALSTKSSPQPEKAAR